MTTRATGARLPPMGGGGAQGEVASEGAGGHVQVGGWRKDLRQDHDCFQFDHHACNHSTMIIDNQHHHYHHHDHDKNLLVTVTCGTLVSKKSWG